MRLLSLAMLGLLLSAPSMAETLRCGSDLISTGDTSLRVQRICGEPAQRRQLPPARLADGRLAEGAVVEDIWEYGPRGGAFYTLRFIDGRLVEIHMSR